MRVLVVTQYFWPENFIINDLCSELVKRGHEVTVLTGKPNYPSGVVFDEYINNSTQFEHYAGCNVVRVPMVARGKGRAIKLILNYFTYAFSATFIGAWKLRKKQFDVIFVFEPSPIMVGLPAVFLKKLKKAPIVFWVQDLWPETLEAIGVVKSQWLLDLVGKLVSFIYNGSDLILGQSKPFLHGIRLYSDDAAKIKYFPNWSEGSLSNSVVSPVEAITKHEGFLKILFAGNVGDAQDFPAILKSVELIKKNQIKAKFFIVGDGRSFEWVKSEIFKQNLQDYIYLLGRYPVEKMLAFYSSVDVLLVTLKESPVFAMTIPSKVQSYMTAGKPILTMLTGEGSRIIEEANCGLIAKSGDYKVLSENIEKMSMMSKGELNTLGLKARAYSEREFDRDKLITQLEGWFVNLSAQRKEGSS
jgi:colanic acid biosynthesis glycosyl transferase WcaI